MSGCGIWLVGNHITHALLNPDDFNLVALQTIGTGIVSRTKDRGSMMYYRSCGNTIPRLASR